MYAVSSASWSVVERQRRGAGSRHVAGSINAVAAGREHAQRLAGPGAGEVTVLLGVREDTAQFVADDGLGTDRGRLQQLLADGDGLGQEVGLQVTPAELARGIRGDRRQLGRPRGGRVERRERRGAQRVARGDRQDLGPLAQEHQVIQHLDEHRVELDRGVQVAPEQPGTEQRAANKAIEVEFRGQKMVIEPGTPEYARATEQHNQNFRSFLRGEVRTANSLANDVVADGGYHERQDRRTRHTI